MIKSVLSAVVGAAIIAGMVAAEVAVEGRAKWLRGIRADRD
ncbi:MAG: hypothetical protein ACR2N2_00080 [Acidimicrobiia bacterium]